MFPTIDKKKTGLNLRKLMDNGNFSVKDVQEYLNLGSVQSVYHWLNGLSMPTIDNLYALSILFKIPIDQIVCGSHSNNSCLPSVEPIPIRPDISEALQAA